MEKKIYMTPETNVVVFDNQYAMLAGSGQEEPVVYIEEEEVDDSDYVQYSKPFLVWE